MTATSARREVVVASPYLKVMPWILIVLGIIVFAFCAYERTRMTTTEQSTVTMPSAKQPTKVTTKEQTISDATAATLLGGAFVLVLSGAFYGRVRKITLGGNGVELDSPADIAEAVTDSVLDGLKASEININSISADQLRTLLLDAASQAAAASQAITLEQTGRVSVPAVPLAPGLLARLSARADREVAARREHHPPDDGVGE
jgi:DNA-binding protein